MPEHVHLLLSEPPTKPLSVALAVIKRSVSARLPKAPSGYPATTTSKSSPGKSAIEKLRYIHRNPVHRGLVEKPEDYSWSSFRNYALDEPTPVTITRTP